MFSKEEENLFSQQSSNDDKCEVSKFVRKLCFFKILCAHSLFIIFYFLKFLFILPNYSAAIEKKN